MTAFQTSTRLAKDKQVQVQPQTNNTNTATRQIQTQQKQKTMSHCVPGLCAHPIINNGRARWFVPENESHKDVLKFKNSLTDKVEAFIPLHNRTVHWYVCGPTVYDACHMGHARAYLTFDILRRILQDYFHYNVIYQVNITDVDDKIILRARQNKLLQEYQQEIVTQNIPYDTVRLYVETALSNKRHQLETKLQYLQEHPLPPETTTSKLIKQRADDINGQQLKLEQMAAMEVAVQAALDNNNNNMDALLTAARDALAEQLDHDRGATVTDQKIFEQHARHFETLFYQDMKALGVLFPDVVTRVTEFVPQITDYILTILHNGYGYATPSGCVYFDTTQFKKDGFDYRKLKPGVEVTAEEMAQGEGALAGGTFEKKHPNDFALWKASKPGEPQWPSPWGPGRPGWHIECSVMASDVFGENLDIHGGGVDLMFPHHDNEMAQAEAYHGCNQWVNYFMHAGHLEIKGLKMSKSLKNFVKIGQALQEHSPRQLRLMFLLQSWDKSMNYSDQTVEDAKAKEKYFKNFFGAVKSVLRTDFCVQTQGWNTADKALSQQLVTAQELVHGSLLNNFDTPGAVQTLVQLVEDTNKYLAAAAAAADHTSKPKHLLVKKVAMYITKMLRVFGLVEGVDDIGFGDSGSGGGGGASKEDTVGPFVDALVNFRDQVRTAAKSNSSKADLLAVCDQVRDQTLAELGIRVEDSTDSSVWKMDDPNVIRKEIEEKRRLQAEAAAAKHQKKLDRARDELEKAKAAAVAPAEMFQCGDHAQKWGSYDADGKPTTTKDGQPLSKSQKKNIDKEIKNRTKAYEKLQKTAGDQSVAEYIAILEGNLAQLQLDS